MRSVRVVGSVLLLGLSACSDVAAPLPASSEPQRTAAATHSEGPAERAVNAEAGSAAARAVMPSLVSSEPAPGAVGVPRSEWLQLELAGRASPEALSRLELECDGRELGLAAHALSSQRLVINPDGQLPPAASCMLVWRGRDGPERLAWHTAAAGTTASILYDRSDPSAAAPFPDDYWSVPDATRATGARLSIPLPSQNGVGIALGGLLAEINDLDGFSPIAPLLFELSAPLDPRSVPGTPAESLDPLASVLLLDIDPASERYGQRMPFRMQVRSDETAGGLASHTALVFPSIPLSPGGHYGLLVTRRARADAGRPFAPSRTMAAALAAASPSEAPAVTRLRELLAPLLELSESGLEPPLPRDDIALALRFGIRSLEDLPADMLAVRERIFSLPAPEFEIETIGLVDDLESPVLAIVNGIWWAPDWRDGANWARDAQGEPLWMGFVEVPFTLALPRAARAGPVPIVMYQHGSPGSAEREVASVSRDYLADAGFAVVGFTDVLNREVSAQIEDPSLAMMTQAITLLGAVVANGRIPDFWAQTNAEQIAFLRLIERLGQLDLLPLGAPDGQPELDVSAPLGYVGISQGANHAPAFLPYAPEIRAAVLVAGGARLAELLLHQQSQALVDNLPILFPGTRPVDVWLGMALFQTAFDRQDAHNHARLLYRDPVELAAGPRRASVLLIAGLEDSLVPNHASDSLAWQLGSVPQLAPVARGVPFLDRVSGPVQANVDRFTSAAYARYVPLAVDGATPTAGCVPPALPARLAAEGHFCAQLAEESRRQRANFLLSALGEVAPRIVEAAVE